MSDQAKMILVVFREDENVDNRTVARVQNEILELDECIYYTVQMYDDGFGHLVQMSKTVEMK